MAYMTPDGFQEATAAEVWDYPMNMPVTGVRSSKAALQTYKDTLDLVEQDLCHPEDHDDITVPIRDLYGGPKKIIKKRNLKSRQQLEEWLGIDVCASMAIDDEPAQVPKQPKCRFIYLFAETSRSRLRISRSMLTRIFTVHQVMPAYLDFVFVFGRQEEPRDLNFGGFREIMALSRPKIVQDDVIQLVEGKDMPESIYQMCFNLKGVTYKTNTWKRQRDVAHAVGGDHDLDELKHEWSIRQAAIYHNFDVVTGRTTWIVTKGGIDIQQRFKDLTSGKALPQGNSFDSPGDCFRSSLAAHVLCCQWATEDWRGYLRWLEDTVNEESAMAVIGPRDSGSAHRIYRPSDIQDIQLRKDEVAKVTMSLKTNIAVISAIRKFYIRLSSHREIGLAAEIGDYIDQFLTEIDEILGELEMHLIRSKLLEDVIADRKELILQHLQGQAAERAEQLTHSMERETIVMRIITSVTLFYLPATFVSTFFSTDVVKYQNLIGDDTNSSFSALALTRWLQVTLPLTFLTVCFSWAAYRWAEKARSRRETRKEIQPVRLASKWSTRFSKVGNFPTLRKSNSPSPQLEQKEFV